MNWRDPLAQRDAIVIVVVFAWVGGLLVLGRHIVRAAFALVAGLP